MLAPTIKNINITQGAMTFRFSCKSVYVVVYLLHTYEKGVIMPLVKDIKHIYEPNPLACGQAVLSMLSGVSVEEIFRLVNTEKETTLKDMKTALKALDIPFKESRIQVENKDGLPRVALLSLETPKCWHWSLYYDGVFYDPEYGVLDDFPLSNRRYYWEIVG